MVPPVKPAPPVIEVTVPPALASAAQAQVAGGVNFSTWFAAQVVISVRLAAPLTAPPERPEPRAVLTAVMVPPEFASATHVATPAWLIFWMYWPAGHPAVSRD